MTPQDKFSLLRTILQTFGLSKEAVDDIIDRISDWLSEKDQKSPEAKEYPYAIRDDFLSPAELSFYLVLKSTVEEWAIVCPKVSLGDLFFAKSSDHSKNRTLTNKIDRKHVDFLLCDIKTVKPLVGIELDDKSHLRADRQERDDFVEYVFEAANLPLERFPVRQAYQVSELKTTLEKYSGKARLPVQPPTVQKDDDSQPTCPKCGGKMILRTAKSGASQGGQFWGCSNYPRCRGIVNIPA